MEKSTAVCVLLLGLAGWFVQTQAAEYGSIVEAAKANGLTMFLEMADKTGFTSQLESPGFIGTVFAPTNEAVETALATAGITKQQLYKNNTLLVDVIMYHVVPGDAISSDRLRHDGTYTSMRGKPLTISKSLGDDVAVNSGSTAAVIDKDIKAGAAMFNIVDNMLVPADELASLNLKQADAVKFYSSIDEAVGWDDSLTTLYGYFSEAGLDTYVSNPKTVATVFAPTDEAWEPIQQMSMYYSGNASAITGSKKQLANLLRYTIVPDRALRASQLKDKTLLRMANGEPVMVHVTDKAARKTSQQIIREAAVVAARISGVDPSMHILLSPNSDGDEATVTTADIIAGRSYVHKIDAVLIPKSTLAYLENFTADSGKKKKKNATVAEAFGGNATANATDLDANATTKAANASVKEAAVPKDTNATAGNATAPAPAKSSAGHRMAVAALVGMPALLAVLLL